MLIDDDGVWISRCLEERLALEIGGRQIWSFVPSRDGRRTDDGRYVIAWPALLQPHLNGRADVMLRSLETGEVLLQESVALGDGQGKVELVDGRGRPIAVSKQTTNPDPLEDHASKYISVLRAAENPRAGRPPKLRGRGITLIERVMAAPVDLDCAVLASPVRAPCLRVDVTDDTAGGSIWWLK